MSTAIDFKTYAEVYSVLNKLGESYISKLPKDLYELICNKSKLYNNDVNTLSLKSIDFLAVLHYKYWTNSVEEKKELKDIFFENEKKNREVMEESYNIDFMSNNNLNKIENSANKITKNPKEENFEEIKNTQMVDVQNIKWYEKIFNNIKNWFKSHKWGKHGSK